MALHEGEDRLEIGLGEIVEERAADAARLAAVLQEEVRVALLLEARVGAAAERRARGARVLVPVHAVLVEAVVRREIEAAAEPPDRSSVRRRRLNSRRFMCVVGAYGFRGCTISESETDSKDAPASCGRRRGGRRRQACAAGVREVHRRLLDQRAALEHARRSERAAGIGEALAREARAAVLGFERGADARLQLDENRVDASRIGRRHRPKLASRAAFDHDERRPLAEPARELDHDLAAEAIDPQRRHPRLAARAVDAGLESGAASEAEAHFAGGSGARYVGGVWPWGASFGRNSDPTPRSPGRSVTADTYFLSSRVCHDPHLTPRLVAACARARRGRRHPALGGPRAGPHLRDLRGGRARALLPGRRRARNAPPGLAGPWLGPAIGWLFAYALAVTGVHLASLVRARLRTRAFRWAVSVPGRPSSRSAPFARRSSWRSSRRCALGFCGLRQGRACSRRSAGSTCCPSWSTALSRRHLARARAARSCASRSAGAGPER